MGYNQEAIRKGNRNELLAQAHWLSKGYNILQPFGHDSHYDFVAENGEEFVKVQVKTAILTTYTNGCPSLWRARNKRGQNGKYPPNAYDILHVVEASTPEHRHWCIPESDVFGIETVTVAREDGEPLRSNTKVPNLDRYLETS
jgi:hypothetical protein